MPNQNDHLGLIPNPEIVRVELARTVREAKALRSLLKLSVQAREDREFVDRIRNRQQSDQGVAVTA